ATHRAARGRNTDLPRVRAALARARVRGCRGAVPARRARADQSDLALGAVPRRRLDERRAARLVPRLADRRAQARARLRRRDRPLHRGAERILGRRALPARRLRRALTLTSARAEDQQRTSLPPPDLA